MRKIHQTPTAAPPSGLFASGEKKKLIAMVVGLVLLLGAFLTSRFKENQYREQEKGILESAPVEISERVEVPTIDAARLEALVSDSSPADRVLLEREAVDEIAAIARNLGAAHYAAMDAREIDSALAGDLLQAPSEARGMPFTVRGWIESITKRRPGGGRPDEHHGRIVMEDDTAVYFIAERADELGEDDFVRFDGLFLKAYNDESASEPGTWIQGPLLVGHELVQSYTSLGVVDEFPRRAFLDVEDDDVRGGITGLPHRPLWSLLAYARDADDEQIAWDMARELDKEAVTEMLMDGSSWRAQPFRLPPSQIMAAWVRRPGENAARQEEITEGWIGNWNWTGEAKVLYFAMPGARRDLKEGDLVEGRGFFLKNYAYEPQNGGMRLASMVVIDDFVPFVGTEDKTIEQVWVGVVSMIVGLGVLLFVLVLRDRKRSQRIQATLTQRRRDRRQLRTDGSSPTPAPPTP